MQRAILFLVLSLACYGQFSQEVTVSDESTPTPITSLFYRDGSNNTQYVCKALANQPTYQWNWTAVTGGGTISTISVSSNVATITFSAAHGLSSGNRIILGLATTASLSGSYVSTVTSTTALTIPTSGVADGSYTAITDANLVITTTAPRTNASVWSIYQLYYTTVYVDRKAWADGTSAYSKACGSKTTYAYN